LKHRTINILSISEAVESCKKKLQKLQKLALLMTPRQGIAKGCYFRSDSAVHVGCWLPDEQLQNVGYRMNSLERLNEAQLSLRAVTPPGNQRTLDFDFTTSKQRHAFKHWTVRNILGNSWPSRLGQANCLARI